MTNATKYRVAQAILVVCVAASALSLSRMVPAGMSGEVHTVKLWFGVLVFFLIVGIMAAVAYYYYRSRRFDTKDQQQIAVETLAKLGEQNRRKL